jgi:hypothetical protein
MNTTNEAFPFVRVPRFDLMVCRHVKIGITKKQNNFYTFIHRSLTEGLWHSTVDLLVQTSLDNLL